MLQTVHISRCSFCCVLSTTVVSCPSEVSRLSWSKHTCTLQGPPRSEADTRGACQSCCTKCTVLFILVLTRQLVWTSTYTFFNYLVHCHWHWLHGPDADDILSNGMSHD
jgi:hypothetical protein